MRFAVFRVALTLLDQFEAAIMAYQHPHHSGGAHFSNHAVSSTEESASLTRESIPGKSSC
jgi:hypothetical protein